MLKIDVGDDVPKQVVSSLVKHYKAEELSDRQVVVYCNIKPGKLCGYESQAMILAGVKDNKSDNEICELLTPPPGTKEGTKVMCGGLQAGSIEMSTKNISKVWGRVQPVLTMSEKKQACFDGNAMTLGGKAITTRSVSSVNIY